MESTQDVVFSILAKEAHQPLANITPESTLDDLGIDSLDAVQIIFELEDRYGITLPGKHQNAEIVNARGLVAAVERLVAEKNAATPAR